MSEQRQPPVVVVTGPTASGKTRRALALAERFGGEIVNADSMQVYRHLDVGTAKPSPLERARLPHHLFDVVDPDEQYDAGRYAREGARAIGAIHERGRPVFLVGGSGLYIKALLEGLSVGVGRDPELRRDLEAEHERARSAGDPERLHRRLAEIDPRAAAALHPNDRVRIVRALEVHAATGRAPSVVQRARARRAALARAPARARSRPRGARRAHRSSLRGDARGRSAAGGAPAARSRLRRRAPEHASDRIPPHAAGDRRARHARERARGDEARHAPVRAPPAHLAAWRRGGELARPGGARARSRGASRSSSRRAPFSRWPCSRRRP